MCGCWEGECCPHGRRVGIEVDSHTREKVSGLRLQMFDEHDMKTVENFTSCHIPEAIHFCTWCVANQDTRGGSLEDFQVVSLD